MQHNANDFKCDISCFNLSKFSYVCSLRYEPIDFHLNFPKKTQILLAFPKNKFVCAALNLLFPERNF